MVRGLDPLRICDADYDRIASSGERPDVTKEVFRKNAPLVGAMANVWAMLLVDLGLPEILLQVFVEFVNTRGIVACVKGGVAVAEQLLGALSDGKDIRTALNSLSYESRDARCVWTSYVKYFLRNYEAQRGINVLDAPGDISPEVLGMILQMLLFAERFSYSIGGESGISSIAKFLEVNERCRAAKPHAIPNYLEEALRSVMQIVWSSTGFHYDLSMDHFSNGSTSDAGADLGSKFMALASREHWLWGEHRFGLPYVPPVRPAPKDYPVLTPVPKSLTSKRIIAMERSDYVYRGEGYLDALRGVFAANGQIRYINEQDQAINLSLACEASRKGHLCTLDLSGASDSISRYVFLPLIPVFYRDFYRNAMHNYARITESLYKNHYSEIVALSKEYPSFKGGLVKLHTLLTSGHPLTWLTEAAYFRSLVVAIMATDGWSLTEAFANVWAYGDDLIFPSSCFDLVCSILPIFGHKVNVRKSYARGSFRESCGGWFYDGVDITPIYWPRRSISLPKKKGALALDLARACSDMQHKLIGVYPKAAQAAADAYASVVGEAQVTYSSVGDLGCTDLWSPDISSVESEVMPHYQIVSEMVGVKLDPVLEHIKYYQFLKEGPSYESSWHRDVGISSPNRTFTEVPSGNLVFRKVKPPRLH